MSIEILILVVLDFHGFQMRMRMRSRSFLIYSFCSNQSLVCCQKIGRSSCEMRNVEEFSSCVCPLAYVVKFILRTTDMRYKTQTLIIQLIKNASNNHGKTQQSHDVLNQKDAFHHCGIYVNIAKIQLVVIILEQVQIFNSIVH